MYDDGDDVCVYVVFSTPYVGGRARALCRARYDVVMARGRRLIDSQRLRRRRLKAEEEAGKHSVCVHGDLTN